MQNGRPADRAQADAEAIRIRKVAEATAESIRKVNEAIEEGGESYFPHRQIEMLPQVAPVTAEALCDANRTPTTAALPIRKGRRPAATAPSPSAPRSAASAAP